ncbi:ribosomal protein S2 [Evansella vedderi]|uniref:Ribosomal protein S2 n=2 Tax=Evansella vedderi TaxID=38282 RepID=A0ABT9ZZC4_9BACI|nr:lasso peptide biosynthesis B2 protein [Evansella vedderi]MDQ0256592.1 ribosomal protein S2 [Evansella vedderi]
MDWNMKWLLLEAYFYLGWARILKKMPFSKIAPSLGDHMGETTYEANSKDKPVLYSVSQAIHIMSRYTLWESQCLVKAIAAMKMLEKRKVETTLYLGTGKDDQGAFVAHAWLRSGPYYVTGFEGMEKFTVVSKFAKKTKQYKVEGDNYCEQSQS